MDKDEKMFKVYDVSKDGLVTNRRTGYVKRLVISDKGYYKCQLWLEGKICQMRVHRMVALKYIANPMCLDNINHKDGNKLNNHYSNLEWCTDKENMEHAVLNGLVSRGGKHHMAVLSDSDVIRIRSRISIGESYRKIWEDYKRVIGWWSFRDICRGHTWKHLL